MSIHKTDCLIYRYYRDKLHISFIELFEGDIEDPNFCQKAEFYFANFCDSCKYRKEVS